MNLFRKILLKASSNFPLDMKEDYPWVRKVQRMLYKERTLPKGVMDRKIPRDDEDYGVPVRIFYPQGKRKPGAILYFHGGGWVIGDIATYTPACMNLAEATGRVVYSVDYRLAPEYPYPTGLMDCYQVAERLLQQPSLIHLSKPSDLILMGDSAGGNLAAVVSMMLRDQGKPLPGKQVLLYPATYWDHSPDSVFDSVKTYGEEYGLTWQRIEDYMTLYVPDADLRQTPQVSPIMAPDLSRLPETLVITAEYDPLRDEGEAYGRLLQEAGVSAKIVRIPDAIHGFITFPKISSSLTAAYGAINAFLEEPSPGENTDSSTSIKEG